MANSNRLISKATIPHTSHVPYNVEGPSHIAGIIAHAMCVTRIAMLAGTGNQVSSNRAMQYGAKYSHDQGDIFGQAVSSSRKKQMQIMVSTYLGLKELPKPDDAADALAVAICHAHSAKMGRQFKI